MRGREGRLRKRKDFLAVMQRGQSWVSGLIVLRALRNDLSFSRWGIVVSKGVGKAVVRNRVKRRLRGGVRQIPLKPGWDLVLIARSAAAQADFQQLQASLAQLLSRAGVRADEAPGEERGS